MAAETVPLTNVEGASTFTEANQLDVLDGIIQGVLRDRAVRRESPLDGPTQAAQADYMKALGLESVLQK